MLRYQLNPHFLFNTLNAISSLVQLKDAPKANKMIVQLSDFLRYSLDNDPIQRVSLREELNTLKLYLNIEKTRFGERLKLHFKVDPAAEHARIPSLILQPLAENAIKFAIAPMEEGGEITLIARLDGEHVIIEMIDTGPGFEDEDHQVTHEGVGLRNTIDRLQTFYGRDYIFRLERRLGVSGTKAFMRLPLQEQVAMHRQKVDGVVYE